MPPFIYTALLLTLGLWALVVRKIIVSTPDTVFNIFEFLFLFFLATAFSLALGLFARKYKHKPTFLTYKQLYRQVLKLGVFFSLGITILLGMRAFEVFTILNLVLFLILYWAICLQIRDKGGRITPIKRHEK